MTAIDRSEPARGPCVLVVEGSKGDQQTLADLLDKAGYHFQVARSGPEALEAFEKRTFTLLLMDLQVPGMDGVRIARLIRAREKAVGGRVPIVAVTAEAHEEERRRCLAAGMDDYLAGPIGPELLSVIAGLLGKPEQPGPRAVAADWLAGLAATGFDQEAIIQLAGAFVEAVPLRLADLQQALAGGNLVEARQAAHSLKGSLGVFGVKKAIDAAARLEQVGKDLSPEQAAPCLAELETDIGLLVASMREHVEKLS